jgi:translation elongation factor EF-Ts
MSAYPYQRFVYAYVHAGRVGALVEFGPETRLPTEKPAFIEVAKNITMHVTAMNPVDPVALLSQRFVHDPSRTIEQVLREASSELGERISITRLSRLDTEEWYGAPPPEPTPPRDPAQLLRFGTKK